MDQSDFKQHFDHALAGMMDSFSRWEPFEPDASIQVDSQQITEILAELTERLRADYPYFHPRYAGQTLKPPHPVAMLAYTATMLVNPNNHALDGGLATSRMEKAVIPQMAAMFGYSEAHLGRCGRLRLEF
jgi:glutamate/tyrosine decarboxylase-like PLP-dependent enzyme